MIILRTSWYWAKRLQKGVFEVYSGPYKSKREAYNSEDIPRIPGVEVLKGYALVNKKIINLSINKEKTKNVN